MSGPSPGESRAVTHWSCLSHMISSVWQSAEMAMQTMKTACGRGTGQSKADTRP